MRHLIYSIVILSSLSLASTNQIGQHGGIRHYVEEIPVTREMESSVLDTLCGNQERYTRDISDIEIEKVVNIAQKIWKVIEANKPVLNVKYDYANALPKGVKSAEDLDGFSNLQMKAFRHYGVNGFNARVYDVELVATHRYNGSYDGAGKYLENVTILPQKVEVLWGYNVSLKVTKVSAVNVGTKTNPVASLLLESEFIVKTVIKESQARRVYEFRGDSPTVTNSGSLRW